jgi:hypothetical protein
VGGLSKTVVVEVECQLRPAVPLPRNPGLKRSGGACVVRPITCSAFGTEQWELPFAISNRLVPKLTNDAVVRPIVPQGSHAIPRSIARRIIRVLPGRNPQMSNPSNVRDPPLVPAVR